MDFFRQVKDSFTDFSLYESVSSQSRKKTIKYFVLLFTLIFFIGGIRFVVDYNTDMAEISAAIKEQVPDFTLSGGELKVEGPQPILVDGENNEPVMIIDTTGQVDRSVLDEYNEGLFVSKDKLVNKQAGQINEISFKDVPQLELNKQKLVDYLPLLKWLLVVIAIFGYFIKLAWVMGTTMILALIGVAINYLRKGILQFRNIWNIAVYAFTLPWLLELLVNLGYPEMPYFWSIKWGIATFILYKALEAAGERAAGDEPPPSSL